jgi:phage tail-like protein
MAGGRTPPGADDAHAASRFSITVDGVEIAQFSELVELSSGVDPSELSLGPAEKRGAGARKLPGKRPPPTVTLRRGQTNDLGVFDWHHDSVGGRAERRDAVLVIFDARGQAIARYHLESAWPAKVVISGLKAGASEVLYETVTLTCEDIQRVAP